MCIVIDTNRIPSVLNPSASDYREFEPIWNWINAHNTMIVYGGKKYKTELSKMKRYYGIFEELKKSGQAREVDDQMVDKVEAEIIRKTSHHSFNDHAIIAIVIVSRCRWICSNDTTSSYFFKLKSLYPKGFQRPSIYTGHKQKGLLYHRHTVGKCGPCCS
jgi:hypothetical protein